MTRRADSDEAYVIDLCELVLGETAMRQHRFSWLLGDAGSRLPVDAYFPEHELVIEYRERQHYEAVRFFDKPDVITVSGVRRGKQRQIYDTRREVEIPRRGLRLVIVATSDLTADRTRLLRDRRRDLVLLDALLVSAP